MVSRQEAKNTRSEFGYLQNIGYYPDTPRQKNKVEKKCQKVAK